MFRFSLICVVSLVVGMMIFSSGCTPKTPGAPEADFTADVRFGPGPLEVAFTDTSSEGDSAIQTWQWNFGDGETSDEQNPTYTYTENGNYTVTLTVTNAQGSDTRTRTAYIVVGNVWAKRTGGTGDDWATDIFQVTGGYVIVGTVTTGPNDTDIRVMKIDENGELVWTQLYGNAGNDYGAAGFQKSNQTLRIAGTTVLPERNYDDAAVLVLDSDGTNLLGTTVLTFSTDIVDDRALGIAPTEGGGYILTGEIDPLQETRNKGILIKVNATDSVNAEWQFYYGDSSAAVSLRSVVETDAGDFAAIGSSITVGDLYPNIYVLTTDESGTGYQEATIGDTRTDIGYGVMENRDNEVVICGTTDEKNLYSEDVYLAGYDGVGEQPEILWWAKFGGIGDEHARDLLETSTGYYIVAGTTTTASAGGTDAYIALYFSGEDEEWGRAMGGPEDEIIDAMVKTSDGGYILVGSTESWGEGGKDIYIVKVNAQGYGPSEPDELASPAKNDPPRNPITEAQPFPTAPVSAEESE